MKVLFAGGGTAGHINPALAIAGYIHGREPSAKILYIGNKGGMEERLVPAAGFAFKTVTISGFQRKITPKHIAENIRTVSRIFTAGSQAKRLIETFRPDICIGTGGYVSGPVIRAAIKMGIPSVIHEQNAFPGITNKMLAKQASRVLLAVDDARKYFDTDRCMLTGNPVRQELISADKHAAREKLGLDSRPVILSFGGSLGARSINESIIDLLVRSGKTGQFQHIHGYGQYGTWMPDLLGKKGLNLKLANNIDMREYINNMPDCLAAADLVICRAGAITLSELQVQGKASILIPSPNVAENHQYHNAMAMVNRDAALMIEEKDLSGQVLCKMVENLFSVSGKVEQIGNNAKKMAIFDANERIYKIIKEIIG